MLIQTQPPVHLTYCLNIHPGESWAEHFAAIRDQARRVRDRVAPGRAFGLGLRLGRAAAATLGAAGRATEFRRWLADENLYVFTLNGFPYGAFHGARVKEQVYAPDWTAPERRDYTIQLANILAELLPAGVAGSISTAPGSYRAWIRAREQVHVMRRHLADCAGHLEQLHQAAGREIVLALEPEPDGWLEHSGDAGLELLPPSRHLGICLDTCHAALAFEDPLAALRQYRLAGRPVVKMQWSHALEADNTPAARAALAAFAEPVYLHQVRARLPDGQVRAWPDLPEALRDLPELPAATLIRTHFHVPLHWTGSPVLRSTAADLAPELFAVLRSGVVPHLEIETYTFDVLPAAAKPADLVASIAQEFTHALGRWDAARA